MSNFKAGDLCLIVGGPAHLIGKAVTVEERLLPGDWFTAPNGMDCHINERSYGPLCLVSAEGLTSVCGDGYDLIGERFLVPLRGDFQPEQQKSQEVPA